MQISTEYAAVECLDAVNAELAVHVDLPALASDANALGVALVDLERGQCLWPTVSQQGFPSYLFCGAPVVSGSSYCGHHGRQSFIRRK